MTYDPMDWKPSPEPEGERHGMTEIVLVGTVHRDPKGYGKLVSILNEERPDSITLEMSPHAVRFRRGKGRILISRVFEIMKEIKKENPRFAFYDPADHPAIRHVVAILDFPYEYQAAAAVSQSMGIPFRCIDRSDFSREKLSRLEGELVTEGNLRKLLDLDAVEFHEGVRREYGLAAMALRAPGIFNSFSDRSEMIARDQHAARKIRRIAEKSRCRKLLHIAGWEHLVMAGSGESLCELLSDLSPRRRLLEARMDL